MVGASRRHRADKSSMRQSQKSNRPRNKNGRKPSGPSPNRVYESSGPEGKVRGTPQQIVEKYQSLARDKATAGDRVLAEAFLQHAEHYLRILIASQPVRSEERSQDDRGSDGRQSDERGGDDRYESNRSDYAEAGAAEPGGNAADGMAVIGDDEDQDGSVIVDTPENANPGRRRGRRPARRSAQGDDEQGAEGGSDRSGERRQPARAAASEDEPGLELGDPEVVSDTTIRAAE